MSVKGEERSQLQGKLIFPLPLPLVEYRVRGIEVSLSPVPLWSEMGRQGFSHKLRLDVKLAQSEETFSRTRSQVGELSLAISRALLQTRAVSSVLAIVSAEGEEPEVRDALIERVGREVERWLSLHFLGVGNPKRRREPRKVHFEMETYENYFYHLEGEKSRREFFLGVLRSLGKAFPSLVLEKLFGEREPCAESVKIALAGRQGQAQAILKLCFVYGDDYEQFGKVLLELSDALEKDDGHPLWGRVKFGKRNSLSSFSMKVGGLDRHGTGEAKELEDIYSIRIKPIMILATLEMDVKNVYEKLGSEVIEIYSSNRCAVAAVDEDWWNSAEGKQAVLTERSEKVRMRREEIETLKRELSVNDDESATRVTARERLIGGWKVFQWLVLGEKPSFVEDNLCVLGRLFPALQQMLQMEGREVVLGMLLGKKLRDVAYLSVEGVDPEKVVSYILKFDQEDVDKYRTLCRVGLFSIDSFNFYYFIGSEVLEDVVDLRVFTRLPGFPGIPESLWDSR